MGGRGPFSDFPLGPERFQKSARKSQKIPENSREIHGGSQNPHGVSTWTLWGTFGGLLISCISQNGFLGIQIPARKSSERFGALRAPRKALRYILGSQKFPKVSKRGFVETPWGFWEPPWSPLEFSWHLLGFPGSARAQVGIPRRAPRPPTPHSRIGNNYSLMPLGPGRLQKIPASAKKILVGSMAVPKIPMAFLRIPVGNLWGPCDFCISQNGPGHFRNGFLGIQKPARKSWKRFGPHFRGARSASEYSGPADVPQGFQKGIRGKFGGRPGHPKDFLRTRKAKADPPGREGEDKGVSNSFQ